MTDTYLRRAETRSSHVATPGRQVLTPREVERRYPELSRMVLVKRRMLALPPEHEVLAGAVVYAECEIERFLAERTQETRPGAPPRCAIYARAYSLFDPSAAISD